MLTGECIKACDYGVNPRFLLGMARVALARRTHEPGEQRRQGVEGFRKVARDVTHISQMQLDNKLLARLGQKPFAGRHVAPADEDGRMLQVVRPAREDSPVYQVAHLLRPDAAVAEHLVRARVDGDDAIEHAGLRIGVELDQNLALVHD